MPFLWSLIVTGKRIRPRGEKGHLNIRGYVLRFGSPRPAGANTAPNVCRADRETSIRRIVSASFSRQSCYTRASLFYCYAFEYYNNKQTRERKKKLYDGKGNSEMEMKNWHRNKFKCVIRVQVFFCCKRFFDIKVISYIDKTRR